MYIIACRAHFCHLPSLGQVGHSPRGTSGSAGTLDWGLMWLGSQSTYYPQCPLTPLYPWWPPMPLHPWCPLHPCQWECCEPVLGSNVISLPVHLPPQCPLTPLTLPNSPWHSDTPWLPLMPLPPCQQECCNPVLGSHVVSLPIHLLPPMPPNIPYTAWQPLTLWHPLMPLHSCQWECCNPVLGSNVISLPVHLPPQYPLIPPHGLPMSYTPWCPPYAPTSLPVRVLQPCTGVPCGQPPKSTCHPQCSLYTPDRSLIPLHPWHPLMPPTLPVGVVGPWNETQCGQAPSPPTTPQYPLTPLHPLPTPWCPYTPDAPTPLLVPLPPTPSTGI